MIKKIIISTTVFIILLAVGTILYFHGYWRFNYPDNSKYPIRGIDVSHHQGEIDWKKIKQEGISFVFIKATEGWNYKDPDFNRNWKGASNAGLLKGAYHFFTFCKSGIEQSQNFINTVPVDYGSLPPVVDFEFVGNCEKPTEKAIVVKELLVFIREVKEKYKKLPIMYVTYDSYNHFLKGEVLDCYIWIRDVFFTPGIPEEKRWTFWQYSSHGRVKGINGSVDLDVFFENKMSDLKKL